MSSPAVHLTAWLLTQGHGTAADVLHNALPDNPDALTCLRDTGGLPPQYSFGQAAPTVIEPGVQVLVRGPSGAGGQATAVARAWDAWNKLAAFPGATLSGRRYKAITPQQPPFFIERDPTEDQGRPLFSFNVLIDADP